MGWVSWPLYIFVFLASFPAHWWPNIWPKMGFPELFEKTIDSIQFIPWIHPYGVSFFTSIHFRVPSLIFGPLMAKYLAEYGVSGTFWQNYWFNSFHTWYLPFIGLVSWPLYIFVFLASFSTSGGQIFGRKWGFRNFLKKTIDSIHFVLGIYPYGLSVLIPVHFRVPSLIFSLLVAKYLFANGVSGTFWQNYWLNSFHT